MVGSLDTSGQSTCSGFLPGFLPGFFPFDSRSMLSALSTPVVNTPTGHTSIGRVSAECPQKDALEGRIGIMRKEYRSARGRSQKKQLEPREVSLPERSWLSESG